MKKTIITSLIAMLCLTGCSFGKNKNNNSNIPPEALDQKVQEDTTLLGQLRSGQGVTCTISTLNGKITIKAKDNKVRMEGISYVYDQDQGVPSPDASTSDLGTSLTLGDEIYLWSGQKGTKYNPKKLSEQSSGITDQQMEIKSWEESVGEWQQAEFGYKCEKISLSDDLFVPPADVQFTDLNEVFDNMQKLIQPLATSSSGLDGILAPNNQEAVEQFDTEAKAENSGL